TALITGSTSGIGKAMAETLAAAGANVALNGFGDAAEIEAQRESLETQFQVKASYHAADMSKPAEIEAMMAAAADTHGRIDILINNAGIQHVSDIADFPPER